MHNSHMNDSPPRLPNKKHPHAYPANKPIRIGNWNVQNIRQVTKPYQLTEHIEKHSLHMLFMTETHLTEPTQYRTNGYYFYFSSGDTQGSGVGARC